MAKFRVVGLKRAVSNIQNKVNRIVQSETNLRKIGDEIIEEIQESTEAYRNPKTGRGYKKYSKEYAKQKGVSRRQVDLRLTGRMMESLKAKVKRKEGKGAVSVDVTGARNKKLAGYHQNGTDKMPARPFMFISKKTLSRIINKLKKDILKRFN